MTDIWIVAQGEYSSYTVIAAFTTMEAADEFARVSNENNDNKGWYGGYGKYEVERIDLNPPNPEVVKRIVEGEPAPRRYELSEEVKARLAREQEERVALVESLKLE
jgi:hypothetical protein